MRRILAATVSVLVAVALSAVVANVHTALNRSRQKRTMADIRTLASALEARAVDAKTYSVGSVRLSDASTSLAFDDLQPLRFEELERALVPKYALTLPHNDGWGARLDVRVGAYDASGRAQSYAIRSLGSDRRPDRNAYATGVIGNFEDDIVFSDGSFTRFPEGT